MCHDVSFRTHTKALNDYLPGHVEIDPALREDFSSAHVQAHAESPYPIATQEEETESYKISPMAWGISKVYNARAEKVLNERSEWYTIHENRCLIPVTGIYEHREIKGWKKKVPYHIKPKERELFCIPGLYKHMADKNSGEVLETRFTLITRAANDVMKQIHNHGLNKHRMPLFLPKELELEWLRPDASEKELREVLRYEIPSEELDYWPVWTLRTNKERPDRKDKDQPYEWEGLPPLGQDEAPALFKD